MRYRRLMTLCAAVGLLAANWVGAARVALDPSMVTNEAEHGAPQNLVDEQDKINDPPSTPAETAWTIPSQHMKRVMPASAYIDLGEEKYLKSIWIYDLNGKGDLIISSGQPGDWTEETTYDCGKYKAWVEIPLQAKTRYVRLTRVDGGSNITEIALYDMTPEEYAELQAQKAAEAQAAAERAAAIEKARAEVANRPVIDLGEPFGQVTLVDEIDVAAEDPGHMFVQDPPDATEVRTILGKPARVLKKLPDEASHMSFRIGQFKLLKPGAAYVLEVEYPEDAPRSMVIQNSGNESALGFHTGAALGDAFHPKYVNNLPESISVPLSGKYETWTMFFNLHDRYSNIKYVRGDGERELGPDDGFTVTIAQWSANNLPISEGAAVSRIRLYEIADPSKLTAKYTPPPEGLPRRHIFWREEMADNVIQRDREGTPGVTNPIDWYKYKANTMEFLGINTYTKDLLEFGAVQHWDSSHHGGNNWAYFNPRVASLWGQIVELMGQRGFSILPYYEYAGSKGKQGLGLQRRAKPLTRDDAYTHIKWVESSNADITDPDTYADFKKMLDITIIQQKDKAKFIGAWMRPRSQIPMGFGDATRKRFAEEANNGVEVTRKQLRDDPELLARYKQWWYEKRRQFLVAMRDYLRENGVEDAIMLYTAHAQEPGVGFVTRDSLMVTDQVDRWQAFLQASPFERDQKLRPVSVQDVVKQDLYLQALLSEPKTWGGWEWNHASPPPDPQNYKETDGVMMTHAINRLYTVSSPKTFDTFRAPGGLAVLRYHSLNENMMYNQEDQPKLGYFCADIERAGPYTMMAEAMAMANGDPRYLGYLTGRNFAKGFPKYVRNFNTAFLSLPALPSKRLEDAASDDEVVVRSIQAGKHGTYLAVINTGMTDKKAVSIKLPATGKVTDAATGEALERSSGRVQLDLYPFQLRALRVE